MNFPDFDQTYKILFCLFMEIYFYSCYTLKVIFVSNIQIYPFHL